MFDIAENTFENKKYV